LSTNKTIVPNKFVILRSMGDIHPTVDKPSFECETLVVDACDKNFVYYWINSTVFKNVKTIFLLSHPCEPAFFSRWYNIQKYYHDRPVPTIYLATWYSRYRNRWADGMENVELIDEEDIKLLRTKIDELCKNSE